MLDDEPMDYGDHPDHPDADPTPARTVGESGVAWEVRDNYPYDDGIAYSVQRGTALNCETAAICWDYGIACVIESVLNLRDGTVQ